MSVIDTANAVSVEDTLHISESLEVREAKPLGDALGEVCIFFDGADYDIFVDGLPVAQWLDSLTDREADSWGQLYFTVHLPGDIVAQ